MRVGLDVSADGRRWSIGRDLDAGTLRIVDRDRGADATAEFLRAGGKDVFGETVTGGLGEPLFRATAYVKQNVLDTDRLEAGLTVELARIADSGGGEASVVRALKALETARREMPGATTGGAVSVDTEVARLVRRIDALKTRRDALAQKRREAAQASAALSFRTRERDAARGRANAAELAALAAERRALKERLDVARAAEEKRRETEREVDALAPEAALFSDDALREVDRLRESGDAPADARGGARALGPACCPRAGTRRICRGGSARHPPRGRAARSGSRPLRALSGLRREAVEAEKALEAQWDALRADGLSEDLVRMDAIGAEEREFVLGAEEERGALELEGVKLDRKVADASAVAAIVAGERAQRVRLAQGLVGAAAALLPVLAWFAWPSAGVPCYFTVPLAVFAGTLGFLGPISWGRAAPVSPTKCAPARGGGLAPSRNGDPPEARPAPAARPRRGAGFATRPLPEGPPPRADADDRRRALAAAATRRDDAEARGGRRRPRAVPRDAFVAVRHPG